MHVVSNSLTKFNNFTFKFFALKYSSIPLVAFKTALNGSSIFKSYT